ncbi:MAG: septal ring lytic transglycosylase RlpA family protein, partial [Candidatus Sericytochromatia bacterium]
SCALTINGRTRIQLEQIPSALQPAIEQDLETLARGLNRLSQGPGMKAGEIQPVLVGSQYEIRHREQSLLHLSPAWASYRHKSQLAALLDLTNQIRRQLGAAPLRNYAFLSSSRANQVGLASWYGGAFHGRRTANGERYNIKEFTAAHKKLPFGTRVLVTNLDSKQSVVVKINDRGPFNQRIIDLSPAAFRSIGPIGKGVMKVKLTVLGK